MLTTSARRLIWPFSCSIALVSGTTMPVTTAIESIHSQLRKIIKTRGHFPSDDAATKLVWLAMPKFVADWGWAAKEWREAMNQFAIAHGDRFTRTANSG